MRPLPRLAVILTVLLAVGGCAQRETPAAEGV